MKYISRSWPAEAFQWTAEMEISDFPKWFQDLYYKGHVFITVNPKQKHITMENKRGIYKAFEKDYIVLDSFKHLHVVSEKTFYGRYEERSSH